jgi:hypothetical protein
VHLEDPAALEVEALRLPSPLDRDNAIANQ